MTTETISTVYEGGKRVAMQRVIYEKSDDLFTLANMQRQYESVCAQILTVPAGVDVAYLTKEKARLESEIVALEAVVDGYAAAAAVEAGGEK